MDSNVQPQVLGQSAGTIEVSARADVARISLELARQSRRSLDIVSRHLDPDVYDNEEFVEAVKELVLNNRGARVRLMVIDARPLVTQNHRLIDLADRVSSYVELRGPAAQHKMFNEAMLVADNMGYVHRQFSDRFEATASFADRRITARLSERMDDLWERGLPDPNFRRLHI